MTATAPSMAAVVSGMAALSAIIASGGNDVQYPRSALRSSSVSKLLRRPKPNRLVSKSRSARIVRSSTVQVLEEESSGSSAAGAGGDSVVSEVAVLEDEPETPGVSSSPATASKRKAGPLAKGGTLSGAEALGKDPSTATLGKKSGALETGVFEDPRWIKGTWDLTKFTKDGTVNRDSVIDAEVKRRK